MTSEDRSKYVLSKIENVCVILQSLEQHPKSSYTQLYNRLSSQLSGGAFSNSFTDARNLVFIHNGDGYSLTDIGKEYLLTKSTALLRAQALNLPLFNRCFYELGESHKSYSVVRDWMKKNSKNIFTENFVGSVSKRFSEFILGYTPKISTLRKRQDDQLGMQVFEARNEKQENKVSLKQALRYFEQDLGLSHSEIVDIFLSKLSEDKQKKVMMELLKE